MKEKQKQSLTKLCTCAILMALSTVLSIIPIWQMPLGGKITLLSMLPICSIAVLYGVKAAILPCFLYGTLQVFLGGVFGWGLSLKVLIGCILLDYIFAYTAMCLSGVFRNKGPFGITAGVAVAVFVRFICHFLSGFILWANFDVFNNPYVYSLCYNGAYMLPELVLTAVGAYLLSATSAYKRIIKIAANKK